MSFNDQAVCLYTSGVLAGFGVAISCLAVPALKETSDPLPAWKRLYKNGSKMAISMIFVTSGLAVKRYLSTEDVRYLMVAGATGFIGPYTGFFMKATNDALFSFKDNEYREKREDENKVKKLISKWAKLQYGRTLLGLVGFAINAWIVSKAV